MRGKPSLALPMVFGANLVFASRLWLHRCLLVFLLLSWTFEGILKINVPAVRLDFLIRIAGIRACLFLDRRLDVPGSETKHLLTFTGVGDSAGYVDDTATLRLVLRRRSATRSAAITHAGRRVRTIGR